MLFDTSLLFYHAGSAFAFTSGEYMSLVGITSSSGGLNVNLGNARDLGIGDGEGTPNVAVLVGTGITSSCGNLRLNAQFQGSTDSKTWTTYMESGPLSTASFVANQWVFRGRVPARPEGVSLPTYYRLNLALTGNGSAEGISTGTVIGGIVLDRADADDTIGQYPSGFTVV